MGTATGSYKIWLENQLKLDKSGKSTSYDTLAKSLLLAKGSLKPGQLKSQSGERVYYASPQEVGEIAEQAARRFLGVRIRCARCHDHPLDVWTQDDYYGFASFFGGVRVEATGEPFAQEVKIVKENSVKHVEFTPAERTVDVLERMIVVCCVLFEMKYSMRYEGVMRVLYETGRERSEGTGESLPQC